VGSCGLRDELLNHGWRVNRKRVKQLMDKMGISAVCPKSRTSLPAIRNKIYS